MKVVSAREAKQYLSGCIDDAQRDRVLITRHGKPAAVLIGVEGRDRDDLMLMQDGRFWHLIERRRKQPTVSLAETRKRLGLPPRATSKPTR